MKHHYKLGHVGLLDAMPLLIAQEKGYFASEGLEVTLTCELGLSTVCGKLADRVLDGACLPAPLPVLLSLGAGVPRVEMQVVLISSWQGMGIVLGSPRAGAPPHDGPLRLGIISPGTSSRLLLHAAAQAGTSALPADVIPVPMAASQLIDFMRDGMLDGFCGIDPHPALARILFNAASVADSATHFAMHPGGVIALRSDRAEDNPVAVTALERALTRAREYCANPDHLNEMGRLLLAQPPYAEIDAATRTAVFTALGRPGWISMRFDGPGEETTPSSTPAQFVERACRGTITGGRTFELKSEIARVFARAFTPRRHEIANT